MRRALATVVLFAFVAGGVAPMARAGPPAAPVRAKPAIPDDDGEAVAAAEAAWSRGGWTEVRELLEPVATDPARLQEPRIREKALCLLADATVNDAALDEGERRRQAGEYLERVLDADPSWRLP